jgi:hypothetical protein
MSKNFEPDPAFPVSTNDGATWYGMTLRDYFAAKAMPMADRFSATNGWVGMARVAYEIADQMLEARK